MEVHSESCNPPPASCVRGLASFSTPWPASVNAVLGDDSCRRHTASPAASGAACAVAIAAAAAAADRFASSLGQPHTFYAHTGSDWLQMLRLAAVGALAEPLPPGSLLGHDLDRVVEEARKRVRVHFNFQTPVPSGLVGQSDGISHAQSCCAYSAALPWPTCHGSWSCPLPPTPPSR